MLKIGNVGFWRIRALLELFGWVWQRASISSRYRSRYFFAIENSFQSLFQIFGGHYFTALASLGVPIIDTPAISDFAGALQHHCFRDRSHAGRTGQLMLRIEQYRKIDLVISGMASSLGRRHIGVGIYRPENHAALAVLRGQTRHLRRVAVGNRALQTKEE